MFEDLEFENKSRKGLIIFFMFLLVLTLGIATFVYAFENIEFEKLCFEGSLERVNNNGTYEYDFEVHHCFFGYVLVDTELGQVYMKKNLRVE